MMHLFPRSAWECRPGRSASSSLRRGREKKTTQSVEECIPTQSVGTRSNLHFWRGWGSLEARPHTDQIMGTISLLFEHRVVLVPSREDVGEEVENFGLV